MNDIISLINKLNELADLANNGISVDDIKVEALLQSIEDLHHKNLDYDMFLDDKQKQRQKNYMQMLSVK